MPLLESLSKVRSPSAKVKRSSHPKEKTAANQSQVGKDKRKRGKSKSKPSELICSNITEDSFVYPLLLFFKETGGP